MVKGRVLPLVAQVVDRLADGIGDQTITICVSGEADLLFLPVKMAVGSLLRAILQFICSGEGTFSSLRSIYIGERRKTLTKGHNMSKTRFDQTNERTTKRLQRDGRGRGIGAEYKAWLGPADVPSLGRSHQVPGWKVGGRPVQLLSNLELWFFYRLEWDDAVVDYQEQKPLNFEMTQLIAKQERIVHPRTRPLVQSLPKNATAEDRQLRPIIMTTDFYVIMSKEKRAYSIKPKDKLEGDGSVRVLEKLKLERLYWEAVGVQWELVTEDKLDLVLAKNVEFVHDCYHLGRYASLSSDMTYAVDAWMLPRLREGSSIAQLAGPCDTALGLPVGASLVLAKHMIARKKWPIDFTKPFHPCRPAIFLADN